MKITVDFETRSHADLKSVGTYAYAEDPTTEIICMAVAVDDGEPRLWAPTRILALLPEGHGLPLISAREIVALAEVADEIEAHNAGFEFAIWNVTGKKYGFQPLDPNQMCCSMALALSFALPASLDGAGSALNLPVKKDPVGHRLMLKMCKPNAKTGEWNEKPEDLVALCKYCLQDVRAERTLSKALGGSLPDSELALWRQTLRMNSLGIAVDIALVKKIELMIAEHTENMLDRMVALTGGLVASPKQVAKLGAWVNERCGKMVLSSTDKAAIVAALQRADLPPDVREVLQIRQSLGLSSTAKYSTMIEMVSSDGRLRDNMVYHKASTGRFAGKGVQLQNFPRPPRGFKQDQVLAALGTGSLDAVEMVYDDVMWAASGALRGMIIAPEGKELIVADYASVEARNVLWAAGEKTAVQMFLDGADIYCDMASSIRNELVTKKDKFWRQLGKTCVAEGSLVLTDSGLKAIESVELDDRVWDGVEWVRHDGVIYQGEKYVISYKGLTATPDHGVFTDFGPIPFGIAASRLRGLTRTGTGWQEVRLYDDYLPANLSADIAHILSDSMLWMLPGEAQELAGHPRKARVYDILNCGPRGRYTVSGVLTLNCILGCGYGMGAPKFKLTCHNQGLEIDDAMAQKAVDTYRAKYPGVPKFWWAQELAFKQALKTPGHWFPAKVVHWMFRGKFLRCKLPSGRMLWYYEPVLAHVDGREQLTYMGVNSYTRKWERQTTFGGKLTENIISGMSRDIMTEALPRLEAAGYTPVLTVHDEIISEVPIGFGSLDEFLAIMTEVPDWAQGCPIGAEGWRKPRYGKG